MSCEVSLPTALTGGRDPSCAKALLRMTSFGVGSSGNCVGFPHLFPRTEGPTQFDLLAHILCKDEGTESIPLCWKIGVYDEVLISGHLESLFIAAERSSSCAGQSASRAPSSIRATSPPPYVRPSERTKFHNYIFDSVGPYPILGAALVAGINQADSTPPEWGQGAEAFGKRFISNFGIAAVTTSARYGWPRYSKKIRSTIAVTVKASCRGWATR